MNSAILLAAGLSNRMGESNKLLLKNNSGLSMINNTMRELQQSDLDSIILVTGYQSEEVLKSLESFSFIQAYNPHFHSGQTSSIQTGVSNLPKNTESFMICLGDMPFINAEHYNKILTHFLNNNTENKPCIVRPHYNNKPGHPVCFSYSFSKDILNCTETDGCKSVIRKNKNYLFELELNDSHFYRDIDTPEDAANSQYHIT